MRRSLELGMVVIVLLLAVIVSLAAQKNSSSSQTDLLKSVPQICSANSLSLECWTVSATPRSGVTKTALSRFLSSVWSANGTGPASAFGEYELQRCANGTGGSPNFQCTLWSTGTSSDARALEATFLSSKLFASVVATR